MPTIAFVAPSGIPADLEALDRAASFFARRGWRVTAPPALWRVHQRYAGSDDERLAALHELIADPAVDVVMAARGGYGLSRLIDRIDWRRAAASGKRFVGHSDFTAFNLALLARGRALSWQGPHAGQDFGAAEPSAFTARHFFGAMAGEPLSIAVAAPAPRLPRAGVAGTLWGGNLSLIAALCGTPYLPAIRGGILFVEDVNEPAYRVERMLHTLAHAGVLARQAALLFGDFGGASLRADDHGYDLDAVLSYWRARLEIPVLTGLPFGHCRDKLTLPVGAPARLERCRGGWRLAIDGAPARGGA
jgi:muramoyltetrapeptide carboxypeptidase